jgi:uncharacterized membrane protein (DUF485 family)
VAEVLVLVLRSSLVPQWRFMQETVALAVVVVVAQAKALAAPARLAVTVGLAVAVVQMVAQTVVKG